MKRQKHKFVTYTRNYDRYDMVMTQHVFSGSGVKRYSGINWIIFLDQQHIVLNTYIDNHRVKIDENFMDDHWNKFAIQYNHNLDVWNMSEESDHTIVEFNDYNKKLLGYSITTTDIDEIMEQKEYYKNKYEGLKRRVKKLSNKLDLLSEEMKKVE